MENRLKISVVLPVYNCEKYIERSIRSVLAQTYEDWELIIVNDGSKDDSEQTALKYAEKDERIRLIRQENQGVSVARNRGIDETTGDLLMFLDADDWYEKRAFEEVVLNWDDSIQMLLFDYYDVTEKGKKQYRKRFKADRVIFGRNGERSIDELELITVGNWSQESKIQTYVGTSWGRAFKADYIKEKTVRFPEGIVNCEDVIFNVHAIHEMEKALYLSKPIYDYYVNVDSASVVSYEKNGERLIANFVKVNQCAKEILQKEKSGIYEKAYGRVVFTGVKSILYWLADEKNKEKKRMGREFCGLQVKGVRKQIWGECSLSDRMLLILCEMKCFCLIEKIVSIHKRMKRVLDIR